MQIICSLFQDALAIAQKTKEALNREDQGTQTPSEESYNFL